jgi:hypothetical protein
MATCGAIAPPASPCVDLDTVCDSTDANRFPCFPVCFTTLLLGRDACSDAHLKAAYAHVRGFSTHGGYERCVRNCDVPKPAALIH